MTVAKSRKRVTVESHLIVARSKARRLRALDGAVAAHEAQFGAINADELAFQARADRARAGIVGTSKVPTPKPARPYRLGQKRRTR